MLTHRISLLFIDHCRAIYTNLLRSSRQTEKPADGGFFRSETAFISEMDAAIQWSLRDQVLLKSYLQGLHTLLPIA